MQVESYYNREEPKVGSPLPDKRIIIGIVVAIIVILLIALFAFPSQGTNRIKITSPDQNDIAFTGSLTINGELVDTFSNSGRPIITNAGKDNSRNITLKMDTGGVQLKPTTVVITNSEGVIVANIPAEFIIINEDGSVTFTVDFADLGIDPELVDGNFFEFNFVITLESEDGSEVMTIQIPYQIFFEEFIGTGCLLINKGFVSDSTHAGLLEVPIKLRVTCDTYSDLKASVQWGSERIGNVEIIFSNGKGSLLTPDELNIYPAPKIGDYDATIYYVPLANKKGEKGKFSVVLKIDNSEQKINFEVANENLEQCLKIDVVDAIIENENDSATITIDSSKCHSEKINIFLCNNDAGCSGGAEEGIIELNTSAFTLTKSSPTKTININRVDLAGIYGLTIHASLPGINKTFVTEKEIFVKPTNEFLVPDKFSISLFEKGSRDSIRVTNNELSEEIEIDSSICNFYESSLGTEIGSGLPLTGTFTNSENWTNDLYNNSERFSGVGLYQSMFFKTIPYIDSVRSTAYSTSIQENEKIKIAYLEGKEFDGFIDETLDELSDAIESLKEVEDSIGDLDTSQKTQLASQMISLVASISALSADAIILSTNVDVATTAVATTQVTASTMCHTAITPMAEAMAAMSVANGTTKTYAADVTQLVATASQLYSLYQQLEALTAKNSSIDVESARENAEETNEMLIELKENLTSLLDYLDLALESAAINDLSTASKEDYEAYEYLLLAKSDADNAQMILDNSLKKHLETLDDLTTLQDDSKESEEELMIAIAQLMQQILTQIGILETKSALIQTNLSTAQTAVISAEVAATAYEASCCNVYCTDGCSCSYFLIDSPKTIAAIASAQSNTAANIAKIANLLSMVNTIYQAWELYKALNANYLNDLINSMTKFTEITDTLYDLQLGLANFDTSLDAAIEAAKHLSELEKVSSDASTYLDSLNIPTDFGEYDKEKLVGMIGTLISNGFVNGAYDGGVYTTENTLQGLYVSVFGNLEENKTKKDNLFFSEANLVEDCDNRVKLKLVDYKINLLQDAKKIVVSNPNVLAYWSFTDPQVFGVFDKQEVGVIFSNAGIKENAYATVSLNAEKHIHSPTISVSGEFGPFNIPDDSVELIEQKYHFKINAKSRKDYSSESNATCEKSSLIGNTGKEALPKIILDWKWDAINSETAKENYLDATQFSILLTKKLGVVNEFVSSAATNCPQNYAMLALTRMTPAEFALQQESSCFLPLTTRYYDGKPAIYYHASQEAIVPEYYDSFFDEPLISSAEQMLDLLQFDVQLIRDGYGLEFQSDFTNYYTRVFLDSSPNFTDSLKGWYIYFKQPKKFYFTNETTDFKPEYDFVIPDAGLYSVKIIADFTEFPIIENGVANSNIIIDLYLKEPIKENYSPFYYTPFDGKVGLSTSNDRRFYGTALNSGSELKIADGMILGNNQKDAFSKINVKQESNILNLNSFASKRAVLLDYSINKTIFSPTIATPLLFELNANQGQESIMNYWLKKEETDLKATTNNLFLLTAIQNCKDFFGTNMLSYVNETPDFRMGDKYGFGFLPAENSGKVFTKTMAYSPTDSFYGLAFPQGMTVETTNSIEESGLIPLEGIKGMLYNDASISNQIDGITSLMNAVSNESVCVSKLGDREIYWWSEEYLYEKENSEEKNIADSIKKASNECIK